MVLGNVIAFVMLKILQNRVSIQKSLSAYNYWRKQNHGKISSLAKPLFSMKFQKMLNSFV